MMNTREKLLQIEREIALDIQERADVVRGILIARIAQQHVLMLGPGGTGKSLLVKTFVGHIDNSVYFDTLLSETTDPAYVYGPPNIKRMVEDGVSSRVVAGMLPEATDAFIDEIFNGNTPILHSLHDIMNEREFKDGPDTIQVPLRTIYAGTNKITADADLAAFFDRLHLRYVVGYVAARDSQEAMIANAITRMVQGGRGSIQASPSKTMVTIDELDQAHLDALNVGIDEEQMSMFLDIKDELASQGVIVSDRRMVEGMAAVLSQAWLNGHSEVKSTDLDVLMHMWWVLQDQISTVHHTVLAAANPSEKAALDLLGDLDELRKQSKEATDNESVDQIHRQRVAMEVVKNTGRLIREAQVLREKALTSGASTRRIEEVISKAEGVRKATATKVLGITPEQLVTL